MQALGFLLELAPDRNSQQTISARPLPAHPDGLRLLGIWKECNGEMIVGRDIPSRRLARVLPQLALCDYRAVRADFRIRLAGFGLIRLFGKDISHHYLGEVLRDDEHECLRSVMLEVRNTGAPIFLDIKLTAPHGHLLHFETSLMRVFAADRSTPLVLAGLFFFDRALPNNDGRPTGLC
jgi:hypothetical protein